RFGSRMIMKFVIWARIRRKGASAPYRKIESVILHFPDVKACDPLFRIELDQIVSAAETQGGASAECARADDSDPSFSPVAEPCVQILRPMLMAVKSEAESTVD